MEYTANIRYLAESTLEVATVTMSYYGNCTLFGKDGLNYTLTNFGLKEPYIQHVEPPTAFVAGICSDPDISDNQVKIGL